MRSRRLLVVLVVFIVLCGIAIIGGTVFRVQNIKVEFEKNVLFIDKAAYTGLIAGELKYLNGKNILFNMDKDEIKDIVEKNLTFVEVIDVVADFPNTITVKVQERYPVYLYKEGNSLTLVLDAEMRVLYKSGVSNYTGNEGELTNISGTGISFSPNLNIGDFVVGDSEEDKAKIALIHGIPRFFAGIGNYEASLIHQIRNITFDMSTTGIIKMLVDVCPENDDVVDVKLTIMKSEGEDFIKLFECIWATMVSELSYSQGVKGASEAGRYMVYYATDGQLEVLFDSATDNDDQWDVKFRQLAEYGDPNE
ncbi:MAG: FtsQ-type POTRA domain-containing protein [Christensenellaceae bacterium]|nr:FtsQ-type POTRA domain-containing protein [Christensenellaceae bacterium]